MFQTLRQTEGGSAAQTVTLNKLAEVNSLPVELREHLQQLRLILPVISVSVMALRRQDAEADTDVAHVLSQHACEPLDCEIERVEALLALHTWQRRQEEGQA